MVPVVIPVVVPVVDPVDMAVVEAEMAILDEDTTGLTELLPVDLVTT